MKNEKVHFTNGSVFLLDEETEIKNNLEKLESTPQNQKQFVDNIVNSIIFSREYLTKRIASIEFDLKEMGPTDQYPKHFVEETVDRNALSLALIEGFIIEWKPIMKQLKNFLDKNKKD
jgi:hypothetical protein